MSSSAACSASVGRRVTASSSEAAGRVPARAALLLAALLLAAACAPPPAPDQATHTAEIPLLALQRDAADDAETRWIDLPDGRAPALVGRRDFALRVAADGGGVLQGRLGFAGVGWGESPATRATFRVRLQSDGTDEILFEATRDAGEAILAEPFEVEIPPGDTSPTSAELVLEAVFDPAVPGPARRRAAWIAPRLVRRHPATTPSPRTPSSPTPPNILLITLDTTRRDVLGVYGGPAATPHLDALATSGTRLDNAFSVAYGTTPSHASLMTSLPALAHGVYDNQTVLPDAHLTLAEILHDAGYRTAAFVGARPLVRELGLARGFDLYDDVLLFDAASGLGDFSRFERRADVTIDRFLAWLDRSGAESDAPFFAWLHFYDPHQPYAPPSSGEEPRALEINAAMRDDDALLERLDVAAQQRYREEIAFVDAQIGRALERLDGDTDHEDGAARQTLVAVIADHGENFLDRGVDMAFGHSGLLDDVTHLPLILNLPGTLPEGVRSEILLGNLDLAPTLLDLVGLESPSTWMGRSFRRALDDGASFRPLLVLESAYRREVAVREPGAALRLLDAVHCEDPVILARLGYAAKQGDAEGRCAQFFDLTADPAMRNPLDPNSADALRLLEIARTSLAAERVDGDALDTASHLEALRALGYID